MARRRFARLPPTLVRVRLEDAYDDTGMFRISGDGKHYILGYAYERPGMFLTLNEQLHSTGKRDWEHDTLAQFMLSMPEQPVIDGARVRMRSLCATGSAFAAARRMTHLLTDNLALRNFKYDKNHQAKGVVDSSDVNSVTQDDRKVKIKSTTEWDGLSEEVSEMLAALRIEHPDVFDDTCLELLELHALRQTTSGSARFTPHVDTFEESTHLTVALSVIIAIDNERKLVLFYGTCARKRKRTKRYGA